MELFSFIPSTPKLSLKILIWAAVLVLVVEGALFFVSIAGMRQRVYRYRSMMFERTTQEAPSTPNELLSDQAIRELVWNYGRNIGLMVFLILVILVGGLYLVLNRLVLTPIARIQQANRKTTPDNPQLIPEVDRPDDEIGELMDSRNRMLKSLQETTLSRQYVETVLDSLADTLVVLNPNGTIDRVNKTLRDLLGYRKGELTGQPMECLFDEDPGVEEELDREKLVNRITGGSVQGRKLHYRSKRGESIPVLFSNSTVNDDDGKLRSIVCVGTDIRDQERTRRQLQQSLEEKNTLLREVHHRVRNNLQLIISMLRLQMRHTETSEGREPLRNSIQRIYSMAQIHQKLYQTESLENVSLTEYLESLVRHVQEQFSRSDQSIRVRFDLEEVDWEMDTMIYCGLIVTELVTNAHKHAFSGRDRGTISVKLNQDPPDGWVLKVQDDGKGVESDQPPDRENLGMQIVTILAERQLGGDLSLHSNGGTTATVYIPEANGEPGSS